MSTFYRDKNVYMSRCTKCDHDLVVRPEDGRVFCSNGQCRYRRTAHPTPGKVNAGPTAK